MRCNGLIGIGTVCTCTVHNSKARCPSGRTYSPVRYAAAIKRWARAITRLNDVMHRKHRRRICESAFTVAMLTRTKWLWRYTIRSRSVAPLNAEISTHWKASLRFYGDWFQKFTPPENTLLLCVILKCETNWSDTFIFSSAHKHGIAQPCANSENTPVKLTQPKLH